ncbi:MAG TPA: hypothetical protein VJU86_10790 [Pyrinomonadaceae bacterium]|nr:hypothetical protein [Pyrinomonadaceae bacterium]
MAKDNENPLLSEATLDGFDSTPELQPFAPAQMVACQECLRTNPPTRINCIYCGSVLPLNEATRDFQKPTLRRLEKWELGYNNILIPRLPTSSTEDETDLAAASEILKLTSDELRRIIECQTPLPLARAGTKDEAELVERRLRSLRVESRLISDAELGVTEDGPHRVRAMDIGEQELRTYQTPESPPISINWVDLILVVVGRFISTRIELKEEKAKRAENRILDSSEFFSDEIVFDFYSQNESKPFRVTASSFDFSCLAERKRLVSGENMATLLEIFRERAPQSELGQSYKLMRKVIEPVWSLEQQNESTGWRRERPGKYSIGSVTAKNNEAQFMRYSLLRRFLLLENQTRA